MVGVVVVVLYRLVRIIWKHSKNLHFDVLGYTISITFKMTTFARDNQIVIGQFVYDTR